MTDSDNSDSMDVVRRVNVDSEVMGSEMSQSMMSGTDIVRVGGDNSS